MTAPEREALIHALETARVELACLAPTPSEPTWPDALNEGDKICLSAAYEAIKSAISVVEDAPAVTVTEGWKPIAIAPKDERLLVKGGTYLCENETFPTHYQMKGVALVSWHNGEWRGEQTESYDEFVIHEPTHFISQAELLALPEIWHDSDCALHNEPATPNGPCDCSLSKSTTPQTGSQE